MRVLIVEDSAKLSGLIAQALTRAGFTADQSETVEDARAAVECANYSAILLDLGLPDGDGMALLHEMRAAGNSVPVLVLTARDGVKDRVEGLDAGADDYVLKPFEMEELLARLRALLRRPGASLGRTLTIADLSLDTVARELTVSGRACALSRRELGVLELLMRRAGRVVPKDAIDDALYGFDEAVTPNSIEVAIHRLRKRLSDAGAHAHVHTLRGIGYMLAEDDP
jgi:DNA-binding response OmpR family regulator